MNIQPAPTRDYRVTTLYVGPDRGRGRMALLAHQRNKAAQVRDPNGRPRHHASNPVDAIEARWIRVQMRPLDAEGKVWAAYRALKRRWLQAGVAAPVFRRLWDVLENRRTVWGCEDCGAVWTGVFRGPCPECRSVDVHEAEVA